MHKAARALLGIVPVGVFLLLSGSMRYVQDDAYITLTYARNLVDGHGPVFNIGEHVEGFTSILWMLLAAIATSVSRDPIGLLQIVGTMAGAATLLMVMRTTHHMLGSVDVAEPVRTLLSTLAATWLACISSFQFWASSAMEAPLFLLLTAGCVDAFVHDRAGRAWVVWGAVSLLTRPEAMLLVGMLGGYRMIDVVRRRDVAPPWTQLGILLGVVLAIELWRWTTYGALLPNTFSAKTTSLDVQIGDGLNYAWTFLRNVMLMGVGMIMALIGAFVTARRDLAEIGGLMLAWIMAVMLLGGDVLRHQRFLLPVSVLAAPLMMTGIVRVARMVVADVRMRSIVTAVVAGVMCVHAVVSERDTIARTIRMEGELVNKMRLTGLFLRDIAQREERTLTIAASTIGALKWYSRQTVIDMLGLTDRTIATRPKRIDVVSDDARVSWKERNYNADYVLERKPDYIVFSTGMKPSAYAERALFARQFYVEYYQYFYQIPSSTSMQIMYRRKPKEVIAKSPQRRLQLTEPQLRVLNDYSTGIEYMRQPETYGQAESLFVRINAEGPPNFTGAWQQLADLASLRRDEEGMVDAAQRAIMIDPCDIRAHFALFQYHRKYRDTTNMKLHGDWVARCSPILFRQIGIRVPDDAY
jgi:arabinofuranosyltransferase